MRRANLLEEEDEEDNEPKHKHKLADIDAFTWEKQYEKSWETIEEDEQGKIKGPRSDSAEKLRQRQRRATAVEGGTVRRGLHRHLFIILDLSKAMVDIDLRPSRIALVQATVEAFIREYFDKNPISQLGLIITRNGVAEKLTELSGNPSHHIQQLKAQTSDTAGDASLMNALEVARASLSFVPRYGSREVLVIMAALTTCDPGDLTTTIAALKKDNIRCSVVGLAAEVRICAALAQTTGGTYGVCLNEEHFRELVLSHSTPPSALASSRQEASLVRMGFPQRRSDTHPSLCTCHRLLKLGGYFCPQCKSKCCELPTTCRVCSLTLVASPHLARSFHHLFPVPSFSETQPLATGALCFACGQPLLATAWLCPRCHNLFCSDCDLFIHDTLHNCPGCEASSRVSLPAK